MRGARLIIIRTFKTRTGTEREVWRIILRISSSGSNQKTIRSTKRVKARRSGELDSRTRLRTRGIEYFEGSRRGNDWPMRFREGDNEPSPVADGPRCAAHVTVALGDRLRMRDNCRLNPIRSLSTARCDAFLEARRATASFKLQGLALSCKSSSVFAVRERGVSPGSILPERKRLICASRTRQDDSIWGAGEKGESGARIELTTGEQDNQLAVSGQSNQPLGDSVPSGRYRDSGHLL